MVALDLMNGDATRKPLMSPIEPSLGVITAGPVRMDLARREVWVRDRRVHFSRQEYDLLAMLLSPPDQVRTRRELIGRLWSASELVDTRTLDTHTYRLRLKVEEDPVTPRFIVTVRGIGFRYDSEGRGSSPAELAALASPVRLDLLRALSEAPNGEAYGSGLVEVLGKNQRTISDHLKVLRKAGLVHRERAGTCVWYSINLGRTSKVPGDFDSVWGSGNDPAGS